MAVDTDTGTKLTTCLSGVEPFLYIRSPCVNEDENRYGGLRHPLKYEIELGIGEPVDIEGSHCEGGVRVVESSFESTGLIPGPRHSTGVKHL